MVINIRLQIVLIPDLQFPWKVKITSILEVDVQAFVTLFTSKVPVFQVMTLITRISNCTLKGVIVPPLTLSQQRHHITLRLKLDLQLRYQRKIALSMCRFDTVLLDVIQ
ncbi:hypothetical protein VIAG107301_18230 [Vibrio agarivorans]